MKLGFNLSNNIRKNTENNFVNNFLNELKQAIYIEMDNKMENNKLITEYRDKSNIERNIILNNYNKEHFDEGELFFVYGLSESNENCFNICSCKEENSSKIITENMENLPENVQVGCILKKENDNYVIDELATEEVHDEIEKMKKEIIIQQEEYLNKLRIEDHQYDVVDIADDRAWLEDTNNSNGEIFEEIKISEELLNKINEGDTLIYKNGEYILT